MLWKIYYSDTWITENVKIIIITPYFYPVKGGITSYVNNLRNGLKINKIFNVKMIVRDGNGNQDIYQINNNKYLFINKAYKILKSEKPDIVHAHGHWYILSPALKYKKSEPITNVVFTFHTEPTPRFVGLKAKRFERMLSKCDAVTFVSKDLMQRIEGSVKIDAKKLITYPGVELKKESLSLAMEFKRKYSLEKCIPILSWIGPLEHERKITGLKMLVQAIALLKRRHPALKLLIAGKGKFKNELETLIKNKEVGGHVKYLGEVEDSHALISATDIYAHISLQEGLPIAVLEAMSLGKPVIASDTGGIPELINNGINGLLVKPYINEIAEAIDKLYADRSRMKYLGLNARRTIERSFTDSKMANEFMRIYASDATNKY